MHVADFTPAGAKGKGARIMSRAPHRRARRAPGTTAPPSPNQAAASAAMYRICIGSPLPSVCRASAQASNKPVCRGRDGMRWGRLGLVMTRGLDGLSLVRTFVKPRPVRA